MSNTKTPALLAGLLATVAPIARELEFNGEKVTVHFSRLTGGQRIALAGAQRITIDPSQKEAKAGVIDVAIADLQRNRYTLVAFTACDEKGKPLFRDRADVEALPDRLADALAELAEDVNSEAGSGNASPETPGSGS
jgi:hypothetical protein